MTIIMAHPAWPWIDEQIAVALHKSNVFQDLLGWMPRFTPETLIRETNTRLQDKTMFGSDYPFTQPDNWLADFQNLQMRDHVIPKVLLENARQALNIAA